MGPGWRKLGVLRRKAWIRKMRALAPAWSCAKVRSTERVPRWTSCFDMEKETGASPPPTAKNRRCQQTLTLLGAGQGSMETRLGSSQGAGRDAGYLLRELCQEPRLGQPSPLICTPEAAWGCQSPRSLDDGVISQCPSGPFFPSRPPSMTPLAPETHLPPHPVPCHQLHCPGSSETSTIPQKPKGSRLNC